MMLKFFLSITILFFINCNSNSTDSTRFAIKDFDSDQNKFTKCKYIFLSVLSQDYGGGYLLIRNREFNTLGRRMAVFHLDRDFNILKKGLIITTNNDDEPVTVIEMRTDSDRVPATYRNTWMMSVIVNDKKRKKIPKFVIPDNIRELNRDEMYALPIRWDSTEYKFGLGLFSGDNSTFSFR